MANSPSPTVEELQLRKRARRRLIGAVTLVAVMVTVLPMVLDDEPKPVGQDIAINIPSQQSSDFTLKVTQPPAPTTAPAPAPTPQATPVEPEKQAAPAVAAAKIVATKQEAPPPPIQEKHQDTSDKPKESKPAPKTAEAPHAGNAYIIMLGAFLSETNAKQRQTKLKELGIKYYEEKIKSPAGEKIGVRAGPYPTRQEAEHALAKLKAAGIQDGLVTEKK